MLNLFKNMGVSALVLTVGAVAGVCVANSSAWAGDLAFGQKVYNTARGDYAVIAGLELNGTYLLRFVSGDLNGQIGGGWSRSDLAVLQGCSADLCVDAPVFNVPRNEFARVAALQLNGAYVLEFTSGALNGQTGGGWSRSDLGVERGCSASRAFCVGNSAYNVTRAASVTIVAIQTTGQMVLRFNDGPLAGQTGAGWSESDLAITQQPTPPPYYPQPPYNPQPPVGPQPPFGQPGQRPVTCTTISSGVRFILTAPTIGQARLGVIDRCNRDPRTDKVACARASSCDL